MRSAVKAGLAVVVLLAAAYFFVYPARTYLGQKSAIASEQQTIAVLKAENGKLSALSKDLNSNSTIEQIARQDYGLVKPGQQAFMVLPAAQARHVLVPALRPRHHWYSSLELWRYF